MQILGQTGKFLLVRTGEEVLVTGAWGGGGERRLSGFNPTIVWRA